MNFPLFHRLARWLFPVDPHIERGEARPVGRKGAGVWLAFDLDGRPACYIVGTGPMMMQPIAAVWGSAEAPLNLMDFRLAMAIAKDWALAIDVPGKCLNLSGCKPGDVRYQSIQDLVLFPTNKKGHQAAQQFSAGCLYTHEGYSKALEPGVVPWSWNKNCFAGKVPTFEMPGLGGGDWAPVPNDLKNYLDSIDPRPNKNGGQMPVTHSAGNCESRQAAATAA